LCVQDIQDRVQTSTGNKILSNDHRNNRNNVILTRHTHDNSLTKTEIQTGQICLDYSITNKIEVNEPHLMHKTRCLIDSKQVA